MVKSSTTDQPTQKTTPTVEQAKLLPAADQPTQKTTPTVKQTQSLPAARVTSKKSRSRQHPVQPDTPEYLIPRMDDLPVSDAVHYKTVHLTSSSGADKPTVFSGPLKLKPLVADAQLPATGVILTHEQGWFARGMALGNLLHSIALAPGEVTQVAVVDWRRQESGSAKEETSQDDSVSATDQRSRAINEIQDSTLQEVQLGASSAKSNSDSKESGSSILSSLFGSPDGSGSNTTTASSTNYSVGKRDLSLSENQRINAKTVRNAQASRSRRAAVVRETSQAEGEQLTTRVLANYNHTHAMTMMYFEVIEVFDLTTKVVDAERIIYLPMEVVEIDEPLLRQYGSQLAQAARFQGDTALADKIKRWLKTHRHQPAFSLQAPVKFEHKWDDKGSGGHECGSFFRIVPPSGCFSLGDYAQASYEKPTLNGIRVIKPLEDGVVTPPVNFERIWNDAGSGAKEDGSFWRPIPESGYVSLGTVVQSGNDKPDLKSVVCVREDLVVPAKAGSEIWSSRGTDSNVNFAAWAVEPSDKSGLRCGTFVGIEQSWERPTDNTQLYCLNEAFSSLPFEESLQILAQLNHKRLFYNQVMWISQEPGAVIESLRSLKWPDDAKQPLSELVDPSPVTLTGNYVGYRWRFENLEQREAFRKQYIDAPDASDMSHSVSVAVPTGGVFGEAVLGQSVSAEKIDLTRFWKWQDSPIPILPSQISPLQAGGLARDINTATGQLDESSAKLNQLTALPAPAGFSAASQMMTSNIFRDMSGSDVVKELALSASQHAADGADNAAQLATQNLESFMGLMKDLAQMGMQQGGMDSTTLGGLQSEPGEEAPSDSEDVSSELTESGGEESVGAELGEVATEVAPFAVAV